MSFTCTLVNSSRTDLINHKHYWLWLLAIVFGSSWTVGHSPDSHAVEFDVGGTSKFEYLCNSVQSTARQDIEQFSISKLVLEVNAVFNPEVELTLDLAIEDINTPDYEPLFIKQLILTHRRDHYDFFVGRLELPFGHFQTAVVSDPLSKDFGESKTDSGFGIRSKSLTANMDWNIVAFASSYRNQGPDTPGITANIRHDIGSGLTVKLGYLSHQYAEANRPALAQGHLSWARNTWEFAISHITTLENQDGNTFHSLNLDTKFKLNPRLALGTRVQRAAYTPSARSERTHYHDWAIALKYSPLAQLLLGLEFSSSRTSCCARALETSKQVVTQLNISF